MYAVFQCHAVNETTVIYLEGRYIFVPCWVSSTCARSFHSHLVP